MPGRYEPTPNSEAHALPQAINADARPARASAMRDSRWREVRLGQRACSSLRLFQPTRSSIRLDSLTMGSRGRLAVGRRDDLSKKGSAPDERTGAKVDSQMMVRFGPVPSGALKWLLAGRACGTCSKPAQTRNATVDRAGLLIL